MTEYKVKLRFYLPAFDSTVISASTDAEAYHLAKAAAHHMMGSMSYPEEIDIEERCEGLISYIDRLGDGEGRAELTEAVMFEDDRPLHPEARSLIARLAAMNGDIDPGDACAALRGLTAAARVVPTNATSWIADASACASPWTVDQVFDYLGDPDSFEVCLVHETGFAQPLDLRLDLRNHSPTGFAWGYSGSGPAQLALAILCHALNSDDRALDLYQHFKDEMIAPLVRDRAWRLTTKDVLGWVLKHPRTSAIATEN